MATSPTSHSTDALERRVERLLARTLDSGDQNRVAKAQEVVRRVPDDATGRLHAYGLYARGLVEDDPELFVQAAAVLTDVRWQARLLGSRALHACVSGQLDEAEELYNRSLAGIREHGFADFEPATLVNLGIIHEARGEPQRGLELLLKARELYARLGNTAGEGSALVSAGPVYRALGAHPEAIGALVEGSELLDGAGSDRVRANGLSNLAKFYAHAGVRGEALRCAEEALEICPPDSPVTVNALSALAFAHSEGGNHEAALEAGERCVAHARALDSDYHLMQALLASADAQRASGRPSDAEAHYREGLALAAGMEFLDMELGFTLGLAHLEEERGEVERARALLRPFTRAVDRYGAQHNLIEFHDLQARLAEAKGDPAEALEHMKRVQTLRADRFSREGDVRVRSIQATQELRRERQRSADVLRELSGRVMQSQEEERRRVASDLHDDLGQRLALLAVEIDMLAQSPPESAGDTATALRHLAEHAQSIAEQVHVISHRLYPPTLAQLGFVKATQAMCEQIASAHGIEVDVHANVEGQVSDDTGLCLYRILQEGLQNATRHAKASQVTVRIGADGGEVHMTISDNGAGFDPHGASGAGIGLAGMKERARHLGGRFTIQSAPGRGARIEVRLPCPDPTSGVVE